jgi:hypothetical protein
LGSRKNKASALVQYACLGGWVRKNNANPLRPAAARLRLTGLEKTKPLGAAAFS